MLCNKHRFLMKERTKVFGDFVHSAFFNANKGKKQTGFMDEFSVIINIPALFHRK